MLGRLPRLGRHPSYCSAPTAAVRATRACWHVHAPVSPFVVQLLLAALLLAPFPAAALLAPFNASLRVACPNVQHRLQPTASSVSVDSNDASKINILDTGTSSSPWSVTLQDGTIWVRVQPAACQRQSVGGLKQRFHAPLRT